VPCVRRGLAREPGACSCAFLAKSCLRLEEFVRVATMVDGPVVSTEVILCGALY
jgi:hypothetical protein